MEPDKGKVSLAAAELRRHAETLWRMKMAKLPPRAEVDAQRLIQELEVHQIELEMQGEEFSRAKDEMELLLTKYTNLYDFAPVSYFTLDPSGTISAVNLTGASFLGVERSKLLGRSFGLFVAEEDGLTFAGFLRGLFAGQDRSACEVSLAKEGNIHCCVHLEAMADVSGEACNVALVDITERKRAETMIEKLNVDLLARTVELGEANKELEAFNYTVAHDLGQPLNLLSTYCQAMQMMCRLEDECAMHVQGAHNVTMRMSGIINALLNLSRVGHVDLNRKPVNLSSLAHEAITMLITAEPERQVDIRIADGITTNADGNLLRLVLDNLIGNAWKYTCKRELAVIEFGARENGGKMVYFVRDNGIGFDQAGIDGLFTPFQRLPGTEEFKGFGIGLATVERIIHRHGGSICAEGEPGKGATFYFTLSAD